MSGLTPPQFWRSGCAPLRGTMRASGGVYELCSSGRVASVERAVRCAGRPVDRHMVDSFGRPAAAQLRACRCGCS